MSHTLTDGSTFPGSAITVPDDGDGVTGASVTGAFQSLADRTRYLKNQVDGTGVLRPFQHVANYAALKALTSMSANDARYVDGIGVYIFDAGTTPGSDVLPDVVKPGTGTGQWYLDCIDLRGATNGLATIGPDDKVLQPVPNRLMGIYTNAPVAGVGPFGTVVFTETSATYQPVTASQGYADVPGAAIGDLLSVSLHFGLSVVGSTGGFIRCEVNDDHAGTPSLSTHGETEAYTEQGIAPGDPIYDTRTFLHTVGAAGTSRVRLALHCDGTNTVQVRTPVSMVVHHWRP